MAVEILARHLVPLSENAQPFLQHAQICGTDVISLHTGRDGGYDVCGEGAEL